MTIENWKYEDFVKANNGKFSVLDFIHAVSAKVTLPQDFALCMGSLFAPDLAKFDNVIVITEWFDEARFQEYRSDGMSAEQAQAWVNMVELTDIFQGISFDKAKELAEFIVRLWNERIGHKFPKEAAVARVILEVTSEEVFVTIGQFSEHREVSD
ncbi:hypothetical protein [Paraburkholderia sp. C35]|uniref:hypothetical protein n=1 Tax=Paraburkholderia sp. C35 TaxID=2126993 RepID=UPI000D687B6B|nr:hypothetical protein [Paraburkholderia sp. C35]